MRTMSWIVTTGLTVLMLVSMVEGQSMDEMIMMSQASSDDAVQFPDTDTVRLELDMLFTPEDYELMYELDHENDTEEESSSRKKRKAIRYEQKRWTNNEIPYVITGSFSGPNRAQIQAAVNDWNRYTCIQFRPHRSGDTNYLRIQNGGGCSSYVGMSGGAQPLTLAPGCRVKGIIMHEMGHALGFHHEQTRPDRDQYVRIHLRNVNRGMAYNFQKHSPSLLVDHGVSYDYTSIMHYGKTAFSTNGGVTIETLDPAYANIIGKRQTLSFKDVKLANIIYKCGERCGKKSCPGDGFVGKDCKCYCPGNPMKECGTGGGGDKGGETGGKGGGTNGNGGDKGGNKGGDKGGNKGGGKDKGGNGNNNCRDAHPNCASWAARGECSKNPGWMHSNCKKSCNKCSGGNTGGGDSNCRDANAYCPSWAARGECSRNPYYMHITCKKSCKKCGGSSGGRANACSNKNLNCAYWARLGHCRNRAYAGYMRANCPASCSLCSSSNAPVPVCVDKHTSCAYWASVGYCYSNYAYMVTNCKKSCRQC